jgi:hypothetical protein
MYVNQPISYPSSSSRTQDPHHLYSSILILVSKHSRMSLFSRAQLSAVCTQPNHRHSHDPFPYNLRKVLYLPNLFRTVGGGASPSPCRQAHAGENATDPHHHLTLKLLQQTFSHGYEWNTRRWRRRRRRPAFEVFFFFFLPSEVPRPPLLEVAVAAAQFDKKETTTTSHDVRRIRFCLLLQSQQTLSNDDSSSSWMSRTEGKKRKRASQRQLTRYLCITRPLFSSS